jgi:sugar-specific transcriptional regulator TrmB
MNVLTTAEILARIKKTITSAETELFIISPFIKLDKEFFDWLKVADTKKLITYVICGKKRLEPDTEKALKKMENIELRYCENLHAKCVINDQFAVVSSMNLYSASRENFELGTLIVREKEFEAFLKVKKDCFDILCNSVKYTDAKFPGKVDSLGKTDTETPEGHTPHDPQTDGNVT